MILNHTQLVWLTKFNIVNSVSYKCMTSCLAQETLHYTFKKKSCLFHANQFEFLLINM